MVYIGIMHAQIFLDLILGLNTVLVFPFARNRSSSNEERSHCIWRCRLLPAPALLATHGPWSGLWEYSSRQLLCLLDGWSVIKLSGVFHFTCHWLEVCCGVYIRVQQDFTSAALFLCSVTGLYYFGVLHVNFFMSMRGATGTVLWIYDVTSNLEASCYFGLRRLASGLRYDLSPLLILWEGAVLLVLLHTRHLLPLA
jgi:hypothetical protein